MRKFLFLALFSVVMFSCQTGYSQPSEKAQAEYNALMQRVEAVVYNCQRVFVIKDCNGSDCSSTSGSSVKFMPNWQRTTTGEEAAIIFISIDGHMVGQAKIWLHEPLPKSSITLRNEQETLLLSFRQVE